MRNQGSIRSLANRTGPVLIGKGLQYTGALVYAFVIPRVMGPETYGLYAVFTSLLVVLYLLGDFGTFAIYGHYVPGYQVEREDNKIQRLFSNLLLFKLGVGLIIGLIFVLVGQLVLPEWPVEWFWLGAATIMVRIAADNYFQLAYGLDNMIRWIARESLRFLVQFVLVLTLFYRFSIPGAITGILLTDIVFFLYGLSWAWRYFRIETINFKVLSPYLRFGAAFFVAAALMMGSQRGGSVLLAAWKVPPEEIAYFDLAFNIFLILAGTMSQLVLAFMPTLTQWKTVRQDENVTIAINVLWKACALGALIVVAVVWALADELIPFLLGEAYVPVVPYLRIIILGIVPLSLGQMNFVIANVFKKPRMRLWAGLVTLLVFLGFSIALIPSYGGLASAIASLASVIALAIVTYWTSKPVLYMGGWRSEIAFVRSRLNLSR